MPALGGTENSVYVSALRRIVRVAGLGMAFMVLLLGILIRKGIFDNSHYTSDGVLALICLGFVAVGVWQLRWGRSTKQELVAVAVYHLFASLYLLFISGVTGPAIIAWIMLLIASDLYFGRIAYMLSMLLLLATLFASIALTRDFSLQQLNQGLGSAVVIAVTGFFVTRLHSVDDEERVAFATTRKKEVLQHERLTSLINGMADAVISTNEKGVINAYNAAALSLLDTNQTLIGRSIDMLFNLIDDTLRPIKLSQVLGETRSHVILDDYLHRYDDGEVVNLYISIAPVHPNYQQKGQRGFIIVMRDITKEKSLEEERDEFISVVSHELRTPVAITEGTISNLALMFDRGIGDKAQIQQAIESAHEQVVYLAKMVNDLSTLSRAERGVADAPEPIDVSEMIQALYAQYRPSAEAKGLILNIDAGPRLGAVMASRLYLEEILQNFITNSIKYTKEGSVTLQAQRKLGTVSFSVSDTGIGMSKTDQKHVFEKFYRSEDYRTRETAGTGLGLYVVRKLAGKLNTNIRLKSRLNHGSTFSFDMPVADMAQPIAK